MENQDDLQSFAEHISELLCAPITIEDVNHRLLAYSAHQSHTDSARIATIIGRRVPENIINRLWKEGILPYLFENSDPIIIPTIEDIGLGKRVAISIRNYGEVLGYIWALETDNPFPENHMQILKEAAITATRLVLSHHRKSKNDRKDYQDLFWQLLTGNLQSHDKIANAFISLGLRIPDVFTVILFAFDMPIDTQTEKHISYVLKTTEQIKPLLYTTDKNEVMLLALPSELPAKHRVFDSFVSSFNTIMKERYAIANINCGYGSPRTQLKDVKESYQEALATVSIKRRFPKDTSNLYGYQNLGVLEYIEIFSKSLPTDKENQAIKALTTYDEQHETELVKTLELYLDYDSNAKLTAKHLHIHINTLTYRLKRITEISALDLSDAKLKIKAYIDLKLYSYRTNGLL